MTDYLKHEVVKAVLIVHINPQTQEQTALELRTGWIMLPFTDEIIYTCDNQQWEVLAVKQRDWGHEVYVRFHKGV